MNANKATLVYIASINIQLVETWSITVSMALNAKTLLGLIMVGNGNAHVISVRLQVSRERSRFKKLDGHD